VCLLSETFFEGTYKPNKEETAMKGKMFFGVIFSLAIFLTPFVESSAIAQKYPERPVEFIIPWSPSGAQTLAARVYAPQAEKVLGQPIPIINIPGAGGSVGLVEFMKRPADGYSIITVITDNVLSGILGIYKHSVRELDPIVCLQIENLLVLVRKDSPFKTFGEFVEQAKKNPGKIRFGSSGLGGIEAFGVVKLQKLGVPTKLIGYDGSSPLAAALLKGEVDIIIDSASATTPMISSGQMRSLALCTAERVPAFGDMPTLKELGYDVVLRFFRGIGIKKGVDPSYRKILENAFTQAAHSEEWKKYMVDRKLDPAQGFMNSQDFEKFLNEELENIEKMVKETGYMGK
jgi:tripartite-type tricarboxylate transporter receptor subunit TctC